MKKELLKVSENEDNGVAKVILSGDLSIRAGEEMKAMMLTWISKYNVLEVLIKDVFALDLAGLQLVKALKNSVEEKGKQISINAELSEEMEELLAKAGIRNILNS